MHDLRSQARRRDAWVPTRVDTGQRRRPRRFSEWDLLLGQYAALATCGPGFTGAGAASSFPQPWAASRRGRRRRPRWASSSVPSALDDAAVLDHDVWSAPRIVDSRWAMTSEVSRKAASRARWTATSDSVEVRRWPHRGRSPRTLERQPRRSRAAASLRRRGGDRGRRRRCRGPRAACRPAGGTCAAASESASAPRSPRAGHARVRADRVVEEVGILVDPDQVVERLHGHVAQVTRDGRRPNRVVEARHQRGDRRLAGPGRSDWRRLTRRHRERRRAARRLRPHGRRTRSTPARRATPRRQGYRNDVVDVDPERLGRVRASSFSVTGGCRSRTSKPARTAPARS